MLFAHPGGDGRGGDPPSVQQPFEGYHPLHHPWNHIGHLRVPHLLSERCILPPDLDVVSVDVRDLSPQSHLSSQNILLERIFLVLPADIHPVDIVPSGEVPIGDSLVVPVPHVQVVLAVVGHHVLVLGEDGGEGLLLETPPVDDLVIFKGEVGVVLLLADPEHGLLVGVEFVEDFLLPPPVHHQ